MEYVINLQAMVQVSVLTGEAHYLSEHQVVVGRKSSELT